MTEADILTVLRRGILEELFLEGFSEEDLAEDLPLFDPEGIGLDSLDAVELVVLLEKHFGIVLSSPDEVREAFFSLSTLADFILEHAKKENA